MQPPQHCVAGAEVPKPPLLHHSPTPQAKTIIFVSTCKQVRFLFEAFRKLRPGVPLRALHGKMAQIKRMSGERGPCSMLDANHSRVALVLPATAWCFTPCLLHCERTDPPSAVVG